MDLEIFGVVGNNDGPQIIVVDSDGNIIRDNYLGRHSGGKEAFYAVIGLESGGFLASGWARGLYVRSNQTADGSTIQETNHFNPDMLIVKIDTEGLVEKVWELCGKGLIHDMVVTENFDIVSIAGTTEGTLTLRPEETVGEETITLSLGSSTLLVMQGDASIPEQSEILSTNYRKQYKVTTDVREVDGVKGGSISGEDLNPYEKIKHGDNSQNTIEAVPDDQYEIVSITINGKEYNFNAEAGESETLPIFENMTEDKHVVVTYAKSSNVLTVRKINSDTGEPIPGVRFNIQSTDSNGIEREVTTNDQGIAKTSVLYGSYMISEIETPEGFSSTAPVEYTMATDSDNTVTIENEPEREIIVHHYLKNKNGEYTEIKVADDEHQTGRTGDRYSTLPHVDLDKYELEKDSEDEYILPDNYAGEFTRDIQEINYYYEEIPTPLVVHYYIEGTYIEVPLLDGTPAEDVHDGGYEGDSYTTEYLTNEEISEEYEFCEDLMPNNVEGTYGKETVEVTYYYRKIERTVTIIKNGEEEGERLEGVTFDINGETYVTDENGIINLRLNAGTYTVVETDTLEEYVLDDTPIYIDVTRETENGTEIEIDNEKVRGTVTVYHYIEGTTTPIELDDGSSAVPEHKQDIVGEYYATKPREDASKYDVISDDVENGSGQFIDGNIDVFYYYTLKDTKIIINHLIMTKEGEKTEDPVPLAEEGTFATQEVRDGKVDEEYETSSIKPEDLDERYQLVETPDNASGIMTIETQVINYYYQIIPAKVIVHHYQEPEEVEGEIVKVSDDVTIPGDVKDPYTTEEATDIERRFEFSRKTDNFEGEMTKEDIEVIYYYKTRKSELIIKYIDLITGEEIIDSDHETGNVDDEYHTKPKNIPQWTYEYSSENEDGVYDLEPTIVIYYYVKPSAGVIEKHIDIETEEILADEPHSGNVGEDYEIEPRTFDNYELVEEQLPENSKGKYTDEVQEVIYYYRHKKGDVIERHYDVITNEELTEEVKYRGNIGEEYETHEKEFEGYDLYEERYPRNSKGEYKEEEQIVNYYYIKKAEVHVKYIDKETGKEIEEGKTIEGHVEEPYLTEEKDIKGYELIAIPENQEGEMEEEPIDVIYYYKKIKFNLKIEKKIKTITVNGVEQLVNDDLIKIEVNKRNAAKNTIQIRYSIKVQNTSEVDGSALIQENIPEGMIMNPEYNPKWKIGTNVATLDTNTIKAGETKEFEVIMDWESTSYNMGNKINTVQILTTTNRYDVEELSLADNSDTADLIVTVGTGKADYTIIKEILAVIIFAIGLEYVRLFNQRERLW